MVKVETACKHEATRNKIDDLETKKSFVMENDKPHQARTLLWKLLTTCLKLFAESSSLSFIQNNVGNQNNVQ